MAGLVKLQRGIGATDERLLWAGHVENDGHGSQVCTSSSLRNVDPDVFLGD